jgi:16S rRNA (cytosine967-C5)-methyltransferase
VNRTPTGVSSARRVAFRLLSEVDRGRRLDRAFEGEAHRIPPRDRAWVHELTYGLTRFRGRLDHLLDLHLDRGVASLDPPVLTLLRMGAYQLLYMGSVPSYAAVSQTVSQVRGEAGRGAAGLANAVLRGLSRKGGGPERFPSFQADPLGHLERWGSHPRWLLERWMARFGPDGTRELVEANNRIPSLHLRPLGLSLEAARARLAEAGFQAVADPPGTGTLGLPAGTDPVSALEVLPALVQDPAAGWVVGWVGGVEGMDVADLCAAPGGKGLGLAALGGRVVALDLSPSRLRVMAETVRRLALPVGLVVARGEAPPLRPRDVVLVDAPCTGTGTLARHPDARWRLEAGSMAALTGVQDGILDGAAGIVRPGGLLVYSTCTLEPEENRERIEAFLARHPGFIVEEGEGVPDAVRAGPFLEVLPHRTGTDGAFAARLRRVAGMESKGE